MNKYSYVWVLKGHYGQGWEDLTAAETHKEIMGNLKDYRENEGGFYCVVQRRILNEKG